MSALPDLRVRLRQAGLRLLYRAGWGCVGRLPRRPVAALIAAGSRLAVWRAGQHLETLRHNLAVATGEPVPDALLRRGVASYLRNFYEVLALPGWDRQQVLDRVTTEGEDRLRSAYAGPGAVVALPHSANWDLAGAWAVQTGMPVTSVAEQLADAEFRDFLAFRESLGMRVLSHRDPGTISALAGAVRAGRLVCLVADRDLPGSGVAVSWRGQPVTMPAGPAMIARRTGAALIPAVCHFTPTGMRISFGDVVESRPGRTGLQAMTQQVADFFAAQIARQPEDWHMLQPFFPGSSSEPSSGPAPGSVPS